MLTNNEVLTVVQNIKYKDDWILRYYPSTDGKLSHIQWYFIDDEHPQFCRMWVVDHSQPKSDIVRTALAAAVMAEEHEVREKFRYNGKRIFNPHYDVDRLAEIAGKLENLDLPEPV